MKLDEDATAPVTDFLAALRRNVEVSTATRRASAEQAECAAPSPAQALRMLVDQDLPTDELLAIAAIPRERYFGRRVQIHILNNVRNGHCPEDCGYCAQRRDDATDTDAGQPIASYPSKTEAEVLEEARVAYESGAFRYCMVTAGRGPNEKSVERFADLIRKIKAKYPLQVCLSAGLLARPEFAQKLAEAGLDRYNHNLNTSAKHYGEICSTHDYEDRVRTLDVVHNAGISLCSGVIAGMGENPEDLVAVALDLQKRQVPSIPVNFFLPVPGHAVRNVTPMTVDYGLRILSMFRLMNPTAEIRLAAGREIHFGVEQPRALRVANSLFVSGYLNVKGSDALVTLGMIARAGYEVDTRHSDFPEQLRALAADGATTSEANAAPARDPVLATTNEVAMKDMEDLRPFKSI